MAKTPGAGGVKPGGAGAALGAAPKKPPQLGGGLGMQPPQAPPVNVAGAPPPQLLQQKQQAMAMAKPPAPQVPQGKPGAPGLQGLMGGGVDRNKLAMMMRQRQGAAGPMAGGMGGLFG